MTIWMAQNNDSNDARPFRTQAGAEAWLQAEGILDGADRVETFGSEWWVGDACVAQMWSVELGA